MKWLKRLFNLNPDPPESEKEPLIVPMLRTGIIWHPSPNRRLRAIKDIDLIVLHCTEGTLGGALSWLCNGNRKDPTSAHYLVAKTGEVYQLVRESDTAWHAGKGRWGGLGGINTRSIGIELENFNDGEDEYTAPQLQAALWLCKRACKEYGIEVQDVIGHFHVDPERKTDPVNFPWKLFRGSLRQCLK